VLEGPRLTSGCRAAAAAADDDDGKRYASITAKTDRVTEMKLL
jgi:hypothetical protein